MQIKLKKITIREITKNFKNNQEKGVWGYDYRLNIRPPYQREFIYKDKQRDEVINTINHNFPLNTMYWVFKNNKYELLDGQQRIMSFCLYVDNQFVVGNKYFFNLTKEEQNKILDYEVSIYICQGSEREKLKWFEIINIAGEKLTKQELRNAIYVGAWTYDAKKYFSRTNGPAYNLAKDYIAGSMIRQDYLETALSWICDQQKITIEKYMAKNQNKTSAYELWLYFIEVIEWVKSYFPNYRKIMKGLLWGKFFNDYKDQEIDAEDLECKIQKLINDDEVQSKKRNIWIST